MPHFVELRTMGIAESQWIRVGALRGECLRIEPAIRVLAIPPITPRETVSFHSTAKTRSWLGNNDVR